MATHVYANDEEIACRATEGVAQTAFPDPCWSPPPPSAGPIVVPYGNVAFARDITNGTRTVFIKGKTVAVEDKAYFSTSTGNEPATYAFQKGLRTRVIKGKAYFRSWSQDVVFEGLGVARHTDNVSHNHGSMPSNTPIFPYVSRGWFSHDCKDEERKIKRACQPDRENSDAKKELKKKSKLSQLLDKLKGKKGRRDANGWHWTDDHCAGLEVPIADPTKALEYIDKLSELAAILPQELNVINIVEPILKDLVINAATKAAAKVAAKAAAKQLAGSSVPLAGNIAMGIWSAVDVAIAVGDVSEIKAAASEALEQIDVLKQKAERLKGISKDFEDLTKLSPEEKLKKAQELATETQDALATLNACVRARKCNLVPYKNDGVGNPLHTRGQSKVESADKGGCCNGQTGHHLIYGAMAKDSCPNYDHNVAPTVCVEGTSQHFGSHKRVHDDMDEIVRSLARRGKIASDGTMSVEDAIDAAAASHARAFPFSKCSKKCIKAQLESYYLQMCRGGRIKAIDKNGSPVGGEDGAHE
ncbi:hypothetical protein SDC9_62301 [bioreactor metagenome]|uniref:Tox-GHH2 domain-containing protein n=1 Tax=bioreactor metagenome TaxID=1076179 RepID=A0A644XIZ3_9ZZZZ